MAISTQRLAEYYKSIQETGGYGSAKSPENIVRLMLVESLSPRLLKLYDYIFYVCPLVTPYIESSDICYELGFSLKDASTMLKQLYSYGLIKRERHVGEHGLKYRYKL